MNFVEELTRRRLLQDQTEGTSLFLSQNRVSGYIGFDPTADSLHVGNLVPIMLLVHFQRHGHSPIALVGGATGLIGDPSGRTSERQLLSKDQLAHNLNCLKKQLSRFLDFKREPNPARMVNNHDWFRDIKFIDFLRDTGKYLTVNYMTAKESVRQRLEGGISFTEFSYQLMQAYDFLWLYQNLDCRIQMGGSDQWGNITSGTELIRRKLQGTAYGLTGPLVTNADGSKFGKSEGENIWLDPRKTSPYKFYQYWLNLSDPDAEKIIRMLTLLEFSQIDDIITAHRKAPHQRLLQKAVAEDITCRVHSRIDYENARQASEILFGRGREEDIQSLSRETLLSVFEGVPQKRLARKALAGGVDLPDLLVGKTGIFASKGELRRLVQNNGLLINRRRISSPDQQITSDDLLQGNILLVQKGKKNYFLIIAG